MKRFIRLFIPPIVTKAYTFLRLKNNVTRESKEELPRIIASGILEGKQLLIESSSEWQEYMYKGIYDDKIFNYFLNNYNLKGKNILDIGGHFGYYALSFAEMAGNTGSVTVFEPDVVNLKHLKRNLDLNPELSVRINVLPLAVSNSVGKAEFVYSHELEHGKTSMNHLKNSDTNFSNETFKNWGFKTGYVETTTLDDLTLPDNIYLIKMDIEGAEYDALQGGKNLIQSHKPILIIEVHSIYNMLMINDFFNALDYKITIISRENDGRCIVEARHK